MAKRLNDIIKALEQGHDLEFSHPKKIAEALKHEATRQPDKFDRFAQAYVNWYKVKAANLEPWANTEPAQKEALAHIARYAVLADRYLETLRLDDLSSATVSRRSIREHWKKVTFQDLSQPESVMGLFSGYTGFDGKGIAERYLTRAGKIGWGQRF